jgi:hypothetical protein
MVDLSQREQQFRQSSPAPVTGANGGLAGLFLLASTHRGGHSTKEEGSQRKSQGHPVLMCCCVPTSGRSQSQPWRASGPWLYFSVIDSRSRSSTLFSGFFSLVCRAARPLTTCRVSSGAFPRKVLTIVLSLRRRRAPPTRGPTTCENLLVRLADSCATWHAHVFLLQVLSGPGSVWKVRATTPRLG